LSLNVDTSKDSVAEVRFAHMKSGIIKNSLLEMVPCYKHLAA